MNLRKLKIGERIKQFPGPTWNRLVDVAAAHGMGGLAGRSEGGLSIPQTGIRRIKNASGLTRNRFDVLGISAPLPLPSTNPDGFKSRTALKGVTPAAEDHGAFVILLGPAKADDVVAGCIDGVCVAKVLVESGKEWIEYADVKDGDAGSLQLDLCGTARVLWIESGTGVKWAVIRLGVGPGQTEYRGKLDGALAAGGSATVSIWRYSGSDADTGINVTAHDWLLPSGGSLATATPVIVKWYEDSQKWYVAGWQGTTTTETVVTDIQVDGANAELEKKTNTITVPAKGTESGWTVFHTGDTCP